MSNYLVLPEKSKSNHLESISVLPIGVTNIAIEIESVEAMARNDTVVPALANSLGDAPIKQALT